MNDAPSASATSEWSDVARFSFRECPESLREKWMRSFLSASATALGRALRRYGIWRGDVVIVALADGCEAFAIAMHKLPVIQVK